MRCPSCQKDDDRVIDSRVADGGESIRRRRECSACGKRFTTYERVERSTRLTVVKKDGSRVPFDAMKILAGLRAACGKRPVSEETKERIAHEVETALHRSFDREVPSADIGRVVAARLREVDHIAYIRFASEHHEFRSLEELRTELADLESRPRPGANQTPLFEDGRG